MPYTSYFRNQRVYRISSDSSRYLEYIKRSRSYNSINISIVLVRTSEARKKVESEIEATKSYLAETLARLSRLRY